MNLTKACAVFEKLAPKNLAESWDNVGLLIEPTVLHQGAMINKILLTNDLTTAVLEEAIQSQVQLIYSYHPPLFRPFKRLGQINWKERIVLQCIEKGIAIYSPHTALDAVHGGVNSWLLSPFDLSVTKVLTQSAEESPTFFSCNFFLSNPAEERDFVDKLKLISENTNDGRPINAIIAANRMSELTNLLLQYESLFWDKKALQNAKERQGCGRFGVLKESLPVHEVVSRTKKLLGLEHVMLALPEGVNKDSLVSSIAVCAGSGSSVLTAAPKTCSLYITGEMSHHEVLDCTEAGVVVILTRHSSSERGYLKLVKEYLEKEMKNEVAIVVSDRDREPLAIV